MAQEFLDDLVRLDWEAVLRQFLDRLNPVHAQLLGPYTDYYWTACEAEWATDIAFDSPSRLQSLYPQLVWGALAAFSTRHVMRFLGKHLQHNFNGGAVTHYRDRPEGLSIKHSVNANSIKMYDKGGSIPRIEITINNPNDIRVYRPKEGGDPGKLVEYPMRKGIADLQRRTQVSQRANERYLDALSQFDTEIPLAQILFPVSKPVTKRGQRFRGLIPWERDDLALLKLINRPEFLLSGFRNRDLAIELFAKQQTTLKSKRAASGKISYRLRLLRAHGLIAKIPNTRRYRITSKGRQVCTALLCAQHATIKQLKPNAA